MKQSKKILAVLLALALLFCGCRAGLEESAPDKLNPLKIGIVYHASWDLLSDTIFRYAEYLEQNFDVKFEFATYETAPLGHIGMVRYLCDLGVDVILNTPTDFIPECVQLCEENGIYFMQIISTPFDTDIVEKYRDSPNYIGYIRSDEAAISRKMAQNMLEQGCTKIGLVSMKNLLSNTGMHTERIVGLQDAIVAHNRDALKYVLRLPYFSIKEGLYDLKALGYDFDGLIATINTFFYTPEELKTLYANPDLKLSYFEISDSTREDFETGNLLMVSCGQHNIIGLAFAYAYHYMTSPYRPSEKLELETDYIALYSASDYDQYMKTCIDVFPYSAEEINTIITSLDKDRELLHSYAQKYSLEDLIARNGG